MKKRTVSLAKYSWMGLLLAGSVLAVLAGCGGDDSDKSSAAEPSMETSYASKEDLPSCTSKRMAEVESTEDGEMYVCYDDSWKKIDYTEDEVEDLPSCTDKREGSVAYLSSTDGFVVCKNEKWQKQTPISSDEPKESSSSVSPKSSSGNSTAQSSSSSVKTNYVEVKAKSDLIECNVSNKDVRALVLKDSSYYTCDAKEWKKDGGYIGYDVVADRENLPLCNVGNAKQRVLAKKDSVFFVCDSVKWEPELAEGYLVQNASILGAAHKGPFKFGSPLLLREMLLRNDSLIYSGRKYVDEISSNKGDFVIPKVNMVYPYAELEVRGLWRNEISGDWSKDSMTLRVLTDLTKRTDVNINLLTHLEYDRAVALVNKGYSVYAAKKQADYEIMTALGFATTVEYSENLKTFVASTNSYYDANSTLMAISLLFIGNRSDAEIQKVVDEFRKDVADDGEWNGATAEASKAEMADWAESFDATPVRANVKTWNIVDIPSYENYLTIFWNNAYGLGKCDEKRYGEISSNMNKHSKNYNTDYICELKGWRKASVIEIDTYGWKKGEEGEIRCCGRINEHTSYGFENGSWRSLSAIEKEFGICTANKEGNTVSGSSSYICEDRQWKIISYEEYKLGICTAAKEETFVKTSHLYYSNRDSVYYICKTGKWNELTELECDTYGWENGEEGNVKRGNCNVNKYYVFENGVWRKSISAAEDSLGACVTSRDGEKGIVNSSGYICSNGYWKPVTSIEYELGLCTQNNDKVVRELNGRYYVCKYGLSWCDATTLEIDTYGYDCLEDGSVISGKKQSENKYVCENGAFRKAQDIEVDLDKGCVKEIAGEKIRKKVSEKNDSIYVCGGVWKGYVVYNVKYETLIDERDGQTYKTVVIGEQTWMAENLNYEYNYGSAKSYCYNNDAENCTKYGRLYTWSAAIDSAGTFSTDGKKCGNRITYDGYLNVCPSKYPVRGICPEGWHLPDSTEWRTLARVIEGDIDGKMLKSTEGWEPQTANGIDAYGFNILPAGYGEHAYYKYVDDNKVYVKESFVDQMYMTEFWSSNSKEISKGVSYLHDWKYGDFAAIRLKVDKYDGLNFYWEDKSNFLSVRCVKD